MQRRAAAIYAAFFVLVAAGSYVAIGVAQEPTVAVEDPARSLAAGDQFSVDGRTYTVGGVQEGSTQLSWVNESSRYTAELENNATVPAEAVQWEGQTTRQSATFGNGSTVTVGGTDYRVVVPGVESPGEFTLEAGDSNETYAVGDSFAYQGNQVTVTQISPERVTVAWGEPYRLLVENATDPASFTLTQEFNVSKRLADDPAVDDQTVTRADGNRYVVYEANGTTRPLSGYLPAPETRQFSEGDQVRYGGNQTTVADVTNETVVLTWTGPRTNSLSLAEGGTTTLGGTQYVAHFPGDGTVELSTDVEEYTRQTEAVATFHERVNGLWGITIISGLAAIFLIAMAYLPSRY